MTLHINVFFYKQGNVREVVDVTAVTLNWQETLLGLADAVQWEFRKKNPYITNIYSKSNNAGSYTMETLQLKFSMKSINPKIQSLCNMITTSPVEEKIGVTGKVLLENTFFEVLLMLDITCWVLVTFLVLWSLQMGWKHQNGCCWNWYILTSLKQKNHTRYKSVPFSSVPWKWYELFVIP